MECVIGLYSVAAHMCIFTTRICDSVLCFKWFKVSWNFSQILLKILLILPFDLVFFQQQLLHFLFDYMLQKKHLTNLF